MKPGELPPEQMLVRLNLMRARLKSMRAELLRARAEIDDASDRIDVLFQKVIGWLEEDEQDG